MKPSDAFLKLISLVGGKISHTQADQWIGELVKEKKLEFNVEGKGDGIKFYYTITDRGKDFMDNSIKK
jgi:DNA-binding PadR family transcriptional regulator